MLWEAMLNKAWFPPMRLLYSLVKISTTIWVGTLRIISAKIIRKLFMRLFVYFHKNNHCVKSVQIRSIFCSGYRKIRTRKNAIFEYFSRVEYQNVLILFSQYSHKIIEIKERPAKNLLFYVNSLKMNEQTKFCKLLSLVDKIVEKECGCSSNVKVLICYKKTSQNIC